MANKYPSQYGTWQVQFFVDGIRHTKSLGTKNRKSAEQACVFIGRLEAAKRVGDLPDAQAAAWLDGIGVTLRNRLASTGLIAARVTAQLGDHTRKYIDSHKGAASTKKQLEYVRTDLVRFFGEDRRLDLITHADAKDWNEWLAEERELGKNTRGRHVGRARQFFNRAIDQDILTENPFHGISAAVNADVGKFCFITQEAYAALMDACPDHDWRMIIALARIGGLRCPCEVLAIKWEHILWGKRRILVPEPKLDYLEDRGQREQPLCDELRRVLGEGRDLAKEGEEFVINRYRSSEQNLRTTFQKIIERAGLERWPDPFRNLRRSRSTELRDIVVDKKAAAKMLGHSEEVMDKHYHILHDGHFDRVIQAEAHAKTYAESHASHAQLLQNLMQTLSASSCQEMTEALEKQGLHHLVSPHDSLCHEPGNTGPRTRTGTPKRAMDFESIASANSASPARRREASKLIPTSNRHDCRSKRSF